MTHTQRIVWYRVTLLAFALFLIAVVSGCGGGGGQVTSVAAIASTPGSPVLSVVSISSQQVLLNWSISSGATGYYVYRTPAFSDGAPKKNVGLLASFQDTNLTNGTTYSYQVSAYNTSESDKSAAKTATPQPTPSGTVSIAPTGVALTPGATQIFTASVTGSGSIGVTYSVQEANGGSITGGVYTAPAVSTTQVFHVIATSTADTTRQAVAAVVVTASPPPLVQVTISPQSVSLLAGGVQTFTASATGSSNTGVTYSVQEAGGGTIDAGTGKYTAPIVTATQAFHIIAASSADPTRQAVAAVAVSPLPPPGAPVSISPSNVTLTSGQAIQLGATLPVTFTSSDAPASAIAPDPSNPNGVIFTAPTVTAQTVYHVTATSTGNGLATATIMVNPSPPASVTVSISPKGIALLAGETKQFMSSVTNSDPNGSEAVTWSVSGAGGNGQSIVTAAGTVSSTGVYTAPVSPTIATDVVTATSIANSGVSDSATVVTAAASGSVIIAVN